MDPIQSVDHNPMRAAHEAPRCQHIRLNGRRCAAPALRGQNHCHFHARIQPSALDSYEGWPHFPFIEDATSLQFVLNQVIRVIDGGHSSQKTCALLLYALQIACSNLKNLRAEHPRPEAEDEQPKIVGRHKENTLNGKNCAELSVAELLVSLAAKGLTFDLDAPMPGLRSREDYDRVLEETPRSNPLPTASPGQETADEESGEGSGAPALPPEDGPVV